MENAKFISIPATHENGRQEFFVNPNGESAITRTAVYTEEGNNFLSALDYGNGDKVQYSYNQYGRLVAELYEDGDTVTVDGVRYYYLTNIQGDVVSIVDGEGTLAVHYVYDAWGGLLSTMGTKADTIGVINPLRYRGYVYDVETELYYLQSRYYNPEMGRFLNADAYISTGQGIIGQNMFAYCLNNPVIYIDVSGNFVITSILIGAVVGAFL